MLRNPGYHAAYFANDSRISAKAVPGETPEVRYPKKEHITSLLLMRLIRFDYQ